LLSLYSGQKKIVVSTGIANRNHVELEGLIGFFVNTLVLCTDLSGGPTFRQLLGRVREVTLGAYAHQDMPFDLLVEALQPERDPSYAPLSQVMFVYQNTPKETLELKDVKWRFMNVEDSWARFDQVLFIQEGADRLQAKIVYNIDLFDDSTIAEMLERFESLLEDIADNPDREVRQLVSTGGISQELINDFNSD
jgi:non-ribosomal peptide synthetase component F